jgi:hypothetical protein
MDVLSELLPSSYTVKAEPSAKDSRRQQPQAKQGRAQIIDKNSQSESLETPLNNQVKTLPEHERRTGDDRRQHSMKRGRWLESRDKNDRRTTATGLCLKV